MEEVGLRLKTENVVVPAHDYADKIQAQVLQKIILL